MARLRLYGRDSFVDERLLDARGVPCSRDARLVLMALKPLADREGRLEDRPLKIRLDVFPTDLDLDVDHCLQELAALPSPAVLRYEAGGQRVLQIVVWDQKPHLNEAASKLPPPQKAPKQEHSGTLPNTPEPSGTFASAPEQSGGLGEFPVGSDHISNPDPVPDPVPVPVTTATPGSQERPRARERPPNPLVDRRALVAEGYELIPRIAAHEDLDPTEVLRKASEWNNRSYVRLDDIPDDRLAHTVDVLRTWDRKCRGVAEPGPPARAAPPNPRAEQRKAGLVAGLEGGLNARRKLESRLPGAGGEPPKPGRGSGGAPGEG